MGYTLRETEASDWREYRALRLTALRDPAAPLAFFESYDEALHRSPHGWIRRAEPLEQRTTFIGETPEGGWAGMATALLHTDRHVHIVGVYVTPEHRGTGLSDALIHSAVAWAGQHEVRLDVHQNNERAARFYRALGFRPTGRTEPDPSNPRFRTVELSLRAPAAPGRQRR